MKPYTTQFNVDIASTKRTNLYANITFKDNLNRTRTIQPTGKLVSCKIDSQNQSSKVFGFTVCQKLDFKVLPNQPAIEYLVKGSKVNVSVGTTEEQKTYADFYVDNIETDKTSGVLNITAYDSMQKFSNYTWGDLTWAGGNIVSCLQAISNLVLGSNTVIYDGITPPIYYLLSLVNAQSTDNLRYVLEQIAEVTGTVAYINYNNILCLKKMTVDSPDLLVYQDNYFEFTQGSYETISGVAADHTGYSLIVGNTDHRVIVLSNNIFATLIPSDSAVVQGILTPLYNAYQNTTVGPYKLDWRGNPAVEIGDNLCVYTSSTTSSIFPYYGDVLEFSGGLNAVSEINYDANSGTIENVNTGISTALRTTELKVDKTSQEITAVVSEVNVLDRRVDTAESRITQNTDMISLVVERRSGEDIIKAASIVASINDASSTVKVDADHIELSGDVVLKSSLSTLGQTQINGGNITTGNISANRINGGSITGSSIDLGNSTSTGFHVDSSGHLSTYGGYVNTQSLVVDDGSGITTISGDTISTSNTLTNNLSVSTIEMQHAAVHNETGQAIDVTRYFKPVMTTDGFDTGNWGFKVYSYSDELHTHTAVIPSPYTLQGVHIAFIDSQGNTIHRDVSNIAMSPTSTSSTEFFVSVGTRAQFSSLMSYTLPLGYKWRMGGYGGFVIEGDVLPYTNDSYDIGNSYYKWSDIYATNGTIQTSDRNDKKDITEIDSKYSDLFDSLKPVQYKFKDGHRTHLGFIAQDVEEALEDNNIDTEDFAGFIKQENDEEIKYGLRYTELIGLLVKEVQDLKAEIKQMKGQS